MQDSVTRQSRFGLSAPVAAAAADRGFCSGKGKEQLGAAGYRVPEDVGLASTSLADCNCDCGVDQNSVEIGAVAMRTLAGLVHQNERGIPKHCRRILVEGRWIDGPSLPALVRA